MTSAERSLALPADLASVRAGRLFARDVVREWGCDRLADDVQLGVSELITNAVRHAGTDVLLVLSLGDELRVEVRDADPQPLDPTPPPQDDPYATSGRGLHIIAAVSRAWGVDTGADGKVVWFTLALPDRNSVDADVFELDDRRHDAPAEGERHRRDTGRGDASREMQARATRSGSASSQAAI